ncbi:MAG: hypothetical protein ABII18_12370 [bacterium]
MLDTKDKIAKAITQVWDLKGLSSDLINALVDRASKQKDVLIETLGKEFSQFLEKINVTEEAQKILEGMSLTVQTTINFKRKDDETTIVSTTKPKTKVVRKKIAKKTTKKKKS